MSIGLPLCSSLFLLLLLIYSIFASLKYDSRSYDIVAIHLPFAHQSILMRTLIARCSQSFCFSKALAFRFWRGLNCMWKIVIFQIGSCDRWTVLLVERNHWQNHSHRRCHHLVILFVAAQRHLHVEIMQFRDTSFIIKCFLFCLLAIMRNGCCCCTLSLALSLSQLFWQQTLTIILNWLAEAGSLIRWQ